MADYLKITEVARRLDVSEPTVRRMVKGGKLPSVFIGGAYRVSEEDLEKYLEAAKVRPGDGSGKVQPPQPEDTSVQRRFAEAFSYFESRRDRHLKEVADEESPHFRDATTAALWLSAVESEVSDVRRWLLERGQDLIATGGDFLNVAEITLTFDYPVHRGRERMNARDDKPDELAARRLEKATADAEKSRERWAEWRRAAGG